MTRSKKSVIALTALAAAISGAYAQESTTQVTGSVTLGGISDSSSGQNLFRYEEYRDLRDGATGGMDIRITNGAWWNRLFGENLGRDDQYISLKGGRFGVLKYELFNDNVIHNQTFDAVTPFNGVGTNNLTFIGTTPASNLANWTRFDYSVKHKNYGGFVEGQATPDSPFYVRIDAKQRESTGIRPLGAAGTSPGGPAYELAAPIDWTTTDIVGEVGYTTRKMHLSLAYTYSKFEDNNKFLTWQTPFATAGANTERSTIAMDNKLERFVGNAIFRGLPLDSTLALRGVHTKVTNDFVIPTTFLGFGSGATASTGVLRLANPNQPNFTGDVVNDSFSAAFNSHLARGWDSKVYYNWYKRENDSSHIVFTPTGAGSTSGPCDPAPPTGGSATTCSTEFLHYEKKNAGIELYYKLNPGNRLAIGYDYLDTERERFDFDRSKEQKVWLEWKSGSLDFADLRVKYQHMNRTANFLLSPTPPNFEGLTYRFDAAPLDRDTFKVTIDGSPAPMLDLGVEFIYKKNKYGDTTFGRTGDERQEVNFSASYGDLKTFRITAFADYENVKYDSSHWTGSISSYPNAVPPGSTCSSGCYPWQSEVKDKNYLVGVAGEGYVTERLRVYGSYIWTKADGSVDFAAPSYANAQPITNYDNYKKQTLNIKGIYNATKQFDVTLGYAYEKYDYSDIQMDGYFYNIRTGSNQNYFSGAYAFPNYRANLVYAYLTYRF